MRIRQIKPAFWADSRLAEVSEATRLFYIGLWMIADDAGWLRWDPIEVSRDLYGYEGRARRERRTEAMFGLLRESGRVILHPCGHAEIPKLPDHQHLAGGTKRVQTAFNDHLRRCIAGAPAETRDDPPTPADTRSGKGKGKVMVGNGSVGEGKGTRSRAPEGATAVTDEDLPTHLRVVNLS